jgi:hypothetical protein
VPPAGSVSNQQVAGWWRHVFAEYALLVSNHSLLTGGTHGHQPEGAKPHE